MGWTGLEVKRNNPSIRQEVTGNAVLVLYYGPVNVNEVNPVMAQGLQPYQVCSLSDP